MDVGVSRVLRASFFDRPTLQIAPELLGKQLMREVDGQLLSGRIVELEAYQGPEDLAAHSARGRRTARTEVMYGPPGHAYVYFIYGMHYCMNVVCEGVGVPHAILIRALEPGPGTGRCSGPALLCRSLSIDRSLSGVALEPPTLYLVDDGVPAGPVYQTPRIGVDYAGEWAALPWRFCLDSPYLSKRLPASKTASQAK
jgi:DNA-3-methyladenine glycosylase